MRTRYSIILPIVAILSGIVLELSSLHLIDNFLPNDLLIKAWPVLLVFVALDLIFSQHRFIAALVVLATAAALLSVQFLEGGQNNEIWRLFLKIWPILLIMFGFDWVLSGRRLAHTIVIILCILVLVYTALMFFDVPAVKNLPFDLNVDLSKIIPTSEFNGTMPVPAQPVTEPVINFNNDVPMFSQEPTEVPAPQQPLINANGEINAPIPPQSSASIHLDAASGTINLKAGQELNQLVKGNISLDPAETLAQNVEFVGESAQYYFASSGKAALPQSSNWNLSLSPQRTIALNVKLAMGYVKADLRSLMLSDVSIENQYGPIDVMVPHATGAKITLVSTGDTIRVYVPSDANVSCIINGTSKIEYPQWNYMLSGNRVTPKRSTSEPITVEINSANGNVQIIEFG